MIPEEHKINLINDGITFIRSITEAYGAETGMELWEQISQSIDPELKGQIFFAMLTGDNVNTIELRYTTSPAGNDSFINQIKEVRASTGLGLKDAKDLTDKVRSGSPVKITLADPTQRKRIISNLKNVGFVI